MPDLRIARDILIEAPPDVVWRTITEPEQIAQWFADSVELDLQPGGAGTLVFEHGATTAPLVVVTVEPPERFSFRWSHPDGEEPAPGNSVLVEFTLTEEGDGHTRLRVVESGLDEIGWPEEKKAEYAEDHNRGWGTIFGRLHDVYRAPRDERRFRR